MLLAKFATLNNPNNHFGAFGNMLAVIVYLSMIFKSQTTYIEVINHMTEHGNFDSGSVVEWIVFEIVAFYVFIVELIFQSIVYSSNTLNMVEFVYNVKLVTRM